MVGAHDDWFRKIRREEGWAGCVECNPGGPQKTTGKMCSEGLEIVL